jgi:putative acetyltransferase
MISISRQTPTCPEILELVTMLDQFLHEEFGTLQAEYDQYNSLSLVDGAVMAALDGRAIGCGCFKRYDDEAAEIKRMFVRREHRGSGAAGRILSELEAWAVELGYRWTVLETGTKLSAAIRFYTKSGYSRIDNYGQYVGMPTSICMAKKL